MKRNVDIRYPTVVGMRDQAVQWKINDTIFDLVYAMMREQNSLQAVEVVGTYDIKLNQQGLLSLVLENYTFSGGAHGMTLDRSLTFDLKTGHVYQLGDLFKKNSHYTERLSAIVRKQINERDIPLLEGFPGVAPDQEFFLTATDLVLYYQLYELAAYVYGILQFPVPYTEIQDIIAPRGPIGHLLQ